MVHILAVGWQKLVRAASVGVNMHPSGDLRRELGQSLAANG